MATLSVKQASGFAPLNGVFGFVQKIESKLAQRAVYNKTLAELSSLGARELADLGFADADLKAIARDAAQMA